MDKSNRRFKSDNGIVALRGVKCVAELPTEPTNQMQQILKFITCHLNTAQHLYSITVHVAITHL
jgi:hypothetical protein